MTLGNGPKPNCKERTEEDIEHSADFFGIEPFIITNKAYSYIEHQTRNSPKNQRGLSQINKGIIYR